MKMELGISYFEWGICFVTLCFCWWKYGWNMEVMKGFRKMYKKLESIWFIPEMTSSPQQQQQQQQQQSHVDSWEVRHFKKISTKSQAFQPRTRKKERKDDEGDKSLNFSSLLEGFIKEENSRISLNTCFICQHPNKNRLFNEIKTSVPLKNCLDCGSPADPSSPWYVRLFPQFFYWWRKSDLGEEYNVIDLDDMMKDEKLNWAVKETAQHEYWENSIASLESLYGKHYKRAEGIMKNMRAKQPKNTLYALYVRVASWIIGKFLGQIYPKILVRESQMSYLQEARRSGHPILYLPVHRSHIDYVLISWTLVENDIRNPLVAAGENLNIPVFSLMMKSVGGFFIKRRMELKDLVYKTLLQSYMQMSLMRDNDMEFFIEGGRTRTGKPCLPKGGLLNIVVETLLNNKVDDILVVPVNFSYDRLLEGNYIREQLGQPKVNESFASAAMALWNSLQPKYGNARVDYGHPFSMREFVETHQSLKSNSIRDEPHGERNDENNIKISNQRHLVEALGRHAIYDGVKCFTLTATNALSFLLLNKYRNGIDISTLKKEMKELKINLVERGHDTGYDEDLDQVIDYAAKILGPGLINVVERDSVKYLQPITDLPNVIELSYYSNCVLPIYALESVIATSVMKIAQDSNSNLMPFNLRESELISTCLEYTEILHYEFIFSPPCKSLRNAVKEKIKLFTQQGVFNVTDNEKDDMELEISNSNNLDFLTHLKNLLSPILDAYIASSCVLNRLVDHEADEKRLQMEMLAEIKGKLMNGCLKYGESMALDPIRNFMQLINRWGILKSYKKDLKTSMYYLHDDFNNFQAVAEITQRLYKLKV